MADSGQSNQDTAADNFTVELKARPQFGSAANRRYRRQGLIPGVVYAHGEPSISVLTDTRDFLRKAETATSSQVFTLKSQDKKIDGRVALIKEVQLAHLKGQVLHLDFQALREDEEINVNVPLKFVGESVGVKDFGGVLSIATHELSVVCFPRAIPRFINVEVSPLKVGDTVHANELSLPEGVRLAGNLDETIVSVVVPKAAVEETPAAAVAAEGAEGAEGAAAPAADASAAKEEKGKK